MLSEYPYLGEYVVPTPFPIGVDHLSQILCGSAEINGREWALEKNYNILDIGKIMNGGFRIHGLFTGVEDTFLDAEPYEIHDGKIFYIMFVVSTELTIDGIHLMNSPVSISSMLNDAELRDTIMPRFEGVNKCYNVLHFINNMDNRLKWIDEIANETSQL